MPVKINLQGWLVTFKVASCTFGFRLSNRRFNDRIASFGWTPLDRMRSEISRLSAMSSLEAQLGPAVIPGNGTDPIAKHHSNASTGNIQG